MSAAPAWAAFLRGINVGGKRTLPMAELAAFVADLGATDVRTYIQSGNVAFRAPAAVARRLEREFDTLSEERFGFAVPAVVRSADELRALLANNPFLAAGADEKRLHVALLARTPDPGAVAALDPRRSPPDAFEVAGRDVYLHFPNGVARSRLTNAYLDATLGTTSTLRNWRTIRKLAALLEG